MRVMFWSLLPLLVAVTGAYGVWHSAVAKEFTAREIQTGRAKYLYRPHWYQRTLHFVISFGFMIAGVAALWHLWRSN